LEVSRVRESDIIFIHREITPFFFTTVEAQYHKAGCRIVYDLDDAIFLKIPSLYNPEVGWLRNPKKVHRLMAIATHVVAGNSALAEHARLHARNVSIIPTPVELANYPLKPRQPSDGQVVTVGWMGSRFSAYYVKSLEPVFREITARHRQVRIKLVDVSDFMRDEPRVLLKPWSAAEELSDLHSFDIGIMPLFDDEIARYKSSFKLLQYMAAGLPVVCTPIGMNAEVVQDGVNGFWANTHEEWLLKLSTLIDNAILRRRFGDAGRTKVEREYSVEVNFRRLMNLFQELMRGKARS
jgi:glycosyltransferase involved in cell wall biosynthesis